jgi:hypothetical protein
MYLNLIVFGHGDVKILKHCFPPKLSKDTCPEVSLQAL